MIAFLLPTFLYTQNGEEDPLLRRSWIPELQEEEEREFNRFQSQVFSGKHFLVKKDEQGRNYKLLHNGKLEYILDEEYRRKFPVIPNMDKAIAEAIALKENGFWLESYHLLKGINLCFRLGKTGEYSKSKEEESYRLLNQVIRENSDRSRDMRILGDPYGCNMGEELVLESETFGYKLRLPKNWNFEYSNRSEEVSEENTRFITRYQRLYKNFEREKERSWEDHLNLAEQGLKTVRQEKIVFFIGSLFQKVSLFDKNNFYKIWDYKRGLNSQTMRQLQFKRKELEPGYIVELVRTNEKGESRKFFLREYYFWKKGKGIFLSLSYPQKESENMERTWRRIVSSVQVKDRGK